MLNWVLVQGYEPIYDSWLELRIIDRPRRWGIDLVNFEVWELKCEGCLELVKGTTSRGSQIRGSSWVSKVGKGVTRQ